MAQEKTLKVTVLTLKPRTVFESVLGTVSNDSLKGQIMSQVINTCMKSRTKTNLDQMSFAPQGHAHSFVWFDKSEAVGNRSCLRESCPPNTKYKAKISV